MGLIERAALGDVGQRDRLLALKRGLLALRPVVGGLLVDTLDGHELVDVVLADFHQN